MEGAILEQQDGISDYGSDFTSDEEGILAVLSQQAPKKLAKDSDLLLKDLEDNEGPRGARIPCTLVHERRGSSLGVQPREKSLPIPEECDHSSSTIGETIIGD